MPPRNSVLTAGDLGTRKGLEQLFERTANFARFSRLAHHNIRSLLRGTILGTMFFEASTRTRVSFQAASQRLGGGFVDLGSQSALAKGESEEDTVSYMSQYADVLVIRHPKVGAVAKLAEVSSVPVINAGDGVGEHPTQALLDTYTMSQEGRRPLHDLRVVVCGDIRHSRTFNSLVQVLGLWNDVTVVMCAPLWALPNGHPRPQGMHFEVAGNLTDAVYQADVLYMIRPQKERHAEAGQIYGPEYTLSDAVMSELPPTAIIMHPGPITDEIPKKYDADPRSVYFHMAANGLYTRMALLTRVVQG